MRLKLVLSIVGFMAVLCGISMLIPAIVDFFSGYESAAARFTVSSALSVSVGMLLYLLGNREREALRIKEMFLTTSLIWIVYALLSAFPFYISEYRISWVDSVFEAMSGLTTTGSTILSGLDHMTPGILLWRSILQWIGGAGIVIFAITILPILHIGGMQLFTTESSSQSERSLPTVGQNMRAVLFYFIGLTVVCGLCLKWAGMSWFDAINHALTTVSTGGFSTHDASIAYFHSISIDWIIIIFMMVSSLPLVLGLYIYRKRWSVIKNDAQIGFFFKAIGIALLLLLYLRWQSTHFAPREMGRYIRESLFSIISTMSTTGFVVSNYQIWGDFAVAFFMFLIMAGGCTGSTAGGIKMFRFTVLFRAGNVRLKKLVQPHGVFIPRYGNRAISDDILISVLVFIGLYLGTAIISTLVLSANGLDFISSFSGALTSLSNVGPALGHLIGPDKTFADLSDGCKWTLTAAMLVGRLEFVSIFVLFFPFLWRKSA